MNTVLVTGAAGFIGAAVSHALLERGDAVVGIDNLNDYYDVSLKRDRLQSLQQREGFTFYEADIADEATLQEIVTKHPINKICHLAAQAGVRYSIENPMAYIRSNIVGTTTIFETARKNGIEQVVYASSSSVYGNSDEAPFEEHQRTDAPVSLYAATKKSCEAIAHSYHAVHKLKLIGLRFFTVYGPWGRPDMAPLKFSHAIWNGKPIDVYNHGKMRRDFTFIDDIVDGVLRALDRPFDYEVFNLGGSNVAELETFIATLEKHLGKQAIKNYLPMQPGDVLLTSANVNKAHTLLGWEPKVSLDEGVGRFCAWFKEYYG